MIKPIQNQNTYLQNQPNILSNAGRQSNPFQADRLIFTAAVPQKSLCQRFADWIREFFQSLCGCCKKPPAAQAQATPNNAVAAVQRQEQAAGAGVEMVRGQEIILPAGTRFRIILGDITRQRTDVIVNAANEGGLEGGGTDAAINRAGGDLLHEARRGLPQVRPGVRIPTGEARMTVSGDLRQTTGTRYIAHAVGSRFPVGLPNNIADLRPELPPQQQNLFFQASEQLKNAYRNALEATINQPLAQGEERPRTISFPLISSGNFGWPLNLAVQAACEAIAHWNDQHGGGGDDEPWMTEIRLVLYTENTYNQTVQAVRNLDAQVQMRPIQQL